MFVILLLLSCIVSSLNGICIDFIITNLLFLRTVLKPVLLVFLALVDIVAFLFVFLFDNFFSFSSSPCFASFYACFFFSLLVLLLLLLILLLCSSSCFFSSSLFLLLLLLFVCCCCFVSVMGRRHRE